MKILIVYYSRTGTTATVAKELAGLAKAKLEEIIDLKNRQGILGYLLAGKDSLSKSTTKIEALKNDPAEYDLVIIGTPVWMGMPTPAIKTYLLQNREKIKKAAFFCTMMSSGWERTFSEMEKILGQTPKTTLALTGEEVKKGDFRPKLEKLVTDC